MGCAETKGSSQQDAVEIAQEADQRQRRDADVHATFVDTEATSKNETRVERRRFECLASFVSNNPGRSASGVALSSDERRSSLPTAELHEPVEVDDEPSTAASRSRSRSRSKRESLQSGSRRVIDLEAEDEEPAPSLSVARMSRPLSVVSVG